MKIGKIHSEERNWVVGVLQKMSAPFTGSGMNSICGIFVSVSAVL